MHGCVVSNVATNGLVLKHQAISIHIADLTFMILDHFHIKCYTYGEQHKKDELYFENNGPVVYG